jgi:hypothetical protein
MLQISSLVEGTLVDAVEALAKTAADRRVTAPSYLEKRALGVSDVLGGLGSVVKNHPALSAGLLGGGLGAAAGGLGTSLYNSDQPEHKRKSVWQNALTGGLAGAALGGGAGAAVSGLSNIGKPTDGTSPATFQQGRKKFQISPEALRANPNLLSDVNNMEEPAWPERVRQGLSSAWSGLGQIVPRNTWMGMGAVDAVANSQAARTGERFGFGFTRGQHSTDPQHLIRGLQNVNKDWGMPPEALAALLKDEKSLQSLGRDPLRQGAKSEFSFTHTPSVPETRTDETFLGKNVSSKVTTQGTQPGKPVQQVINAEQLRQAKQLGAELATGAKDGAVPPLFRVGKHTVRVPSGVKGGLTRAAAYGLPWLASYMFNGDNSRRRQGLDEIMERLRSQNLVKEVQ